MVIGGLRQPRTYCQSGFLEWLGVTVETLPHRTNATKTFLGTETRTRHSLYLEMNLCCNTFSKVSVLVDPGLSIGFDVRGLMDEAYNLRQHGYNIADHFYRCRHEDLVKNIDVLLGNDLLYLMKHFIIVNCIKGSTIESYHGFIWNGQKFFDPFTNRNHL